MNTQRANGLRAMGSAAVLATALIWITQAQGAQAAFPSFVSINGQPEGVAVDKVGHVYVSVRADTDQVWRFSPAGVGTLLADLGAPGGNAGGLAVDAIGNIYLARAFQGVLRVTPDGKVSLLPGTEQIAFANALAFDHRGNLYVTETFSIDPASGDFGPGGIWRIPKSGPAELWLRDELLTGVGTLFPFPVGANGIGFYNGNLYVVNADKALVVRVAVRPDGSPGQPQVWKAVEDVPESFLYGVPSFPVMADGLALDAHGNVYVAVVSRSAIVCIDADDRSQTTVAVWPDTPLDTPASLAFGTGEGERQNLFVTNLGMLSGILGGEFWPGPGLVKIHAGTPGLPLP
ncbi:MAG: SMP-30/gluconolactonase/LRE family protein [Verrucomicrobia bacterium]|nr:SMP-30/gluconolactonase/LRE family protein [Verrucomicrobiota bacterium]